MLDFNKKSHKFIVFLLIAIPVLSVGFLFMFLAHNEAEETDEKAKTERIEVTESEKTDSSPVSKEKEEEVYDVPASDLVSEEEKEKAKLIAEKFAQIYGNYDDEKPLDFVYKVKSLTTEEYYSHLEETPFRREGALLKSTVLSYETLPVDTDDFNVLVWNVVLKEDTVNKMNKKVYQKTTILIALEKVNGEWKVKSMDARKEKGSDVQHG